MEFIEALNYFGKLALSKEKESCGLKSEALQPRKLYDAHTTLKSFGISVSGRNFLDKDNKVIAKIMFEYRNERPYKYEIAYFGRHLKQ